MAGRQYTAAEGYTVRDLLHYGFDNISAALKLLGGSASHFDSAGYLAHIGVELLLKAWHLEAFGRFPNSHNLQALWNRLEVQAGAEVLGADEIQTLHLLDHYEKLRYPTPLDPIEIGSEELGHIGALEEALRQRMPDRVILAYREIDIYRKGGRVLMAKKIEEDKSGEA